MSGYQDLTDEQWSRLKSYLPYGSTGKPGRNANNRLFIDALLWMARSGGRWRDLPERFGRFDSVKRRYYLWVEAGVLEAVNEIGAMPVIPSRKNALNPRQTDMALYKERNIVERFFGYLKQFRRVATRYDKHIQNYMGFVYIAAIKIWLK